MQITFIMTVLLSIAFGASAQTFSEWFRQKKTRMKYLRLQVMALAELEKLTAAGYRMELDEVDSLDYVRKQANEQDLQYFASLAKINPLLEHDSSAQAYITMQKEREEALNKRLARLSASPNLGPAEKENIAGIRNMCATVVEDWGSVRALSTPGLLNMSDGDRLQLIKMAIADASLRYDLATDMIGDLERLMANKQKGLIDNDFLKSILQ